MEKHLNIVSFNVPWPANYGGVIDVFYKIKALHDIGVKVILHCFEYGRPQAKELENYCEKVYYYPRRTGLIANLTLLPYNVNSRKDPLLLKHLLENEYPILFEGLHTCYFLNHPALRNRFKIFRECNIEHDYYRQLAGKEQSLLHNLFYEIEACRFKAYQKVAADADLILSVSQSDADYLKATFPQSHVEFVPCFHANEEMTSLEGQSDFVLYHGKLSVPENERAALYLIENVFCKLPCTCVVAGMEPTKRLTESISKFPNIRLEANPDEEKMRRLIREAQVTTLVTFQGTGLKLKLLNSLFAGRHIIANDTMLEGTGLVNLCTLCNSADEMVDACLQLLTIPFTHDIITLRQEFLFPQFDCQEQARKIVSMMDKGKR